MVKPPIRSILGPSHVLRWRGQISDGVLVSQLAAEMLYGKGGTPIWSQWLLDKAIEVADDGANLAILVGDFRFGNLICLEPDQQAVLPLFNDHFLAIDSKAITAKHDAYMLDRCLEALRHWHRRLGSQARYVFWCLIGREVQDRLAGRHTSANGYLHPTFNYRDIVAQLPGLDILDLSPLLRMPMHEVSRLFIDTSSHPSRIGYEMLEAMLCQSLDAPAAYSLAVRKTEAQLIHWAKRIALQKQATVLLTGRSVWLDTLVRYLGAKGAQTLADAGLVVAALDKAPGQANLADISKQRDLSSCAIVVVSAGGADISHLLADATGTSADAWRQLPFVDWEMSARPVIEARKEIPRFQHLNTAIAVHTNQLGHTLTSSMLELGPYAIPTWSGLEYLLGSIASERIPAKKLNPNLHYATDTQYRIEGDVLLTSTGIAFLIGGNHSTLKYAKGELSPSQKSLDNFNNNMASRLAITTRLAIPYAHVIFPDKHSVMQADFPVKPVRRLGTYYLNQLDPVLKPFVLYPADTLAQQSPSVFYPADTHMTDQGSLVVMKLLLAQLGIDAEKATEKVANRIIKLRSWAGDLGNKFSPKLYQNGKLLEPDWPIQELRSPGGFNDGMIDILLSPEAAINKTLLLFGDSSFRVMLKHFSAVFKRIICLRTHYLHVEMLELIHPDIVLTGNAERYLSHVSSDEDAHAFSLYSHLRGSIDQLMEGDFLAAWNALTSPKAEQSKRYLETKGVGFTTLEMQAPLVVTLENAPSKKTESKLKGLIATHHLYRWGGSELVAIEIVEALWLMGHEITIYCPFVDAEFIKTALGSSVDVFTAPDEINLRSYDFVYCQHQTLSKVISAQKGNFPFEGTMPIFIYNHLSPFEQFEFPGPFIEEMFADIILCNSNETRHRISQFGKPFKQAILFSNPAPATFEYPPQTSIPETPIRILSVSNHLPKELSEAFEFLREQGIEITRIGHPNDEYRVTPRDIKEHHAVITIGKTVQYALRARRPVYCYDYFGGPGWLNTQNRQAAADTNFSGRSHPRKLYPEEIANEIIQDFHKAYQEAQIISEDFLQPYKLESALNKLITQVLQRQSSPPKWKNMSPDSKEELRRKWAHESDLYNLVDRNFLSGNPFGEKILRSIAEFRRMRNN